MIILSSIGLVAQAGASSGGLTLPTTNLLAAWDARTGVTEAGTGVSSWVDLHGSYDGVQATDANRPSYNATGLRSKPTIQFNAANADVLIVAAMADASTSQTIYMLCTTATPGSDQIVWDTQTGRLYLMNRAANLRLFDGSNVTLGNTLNGTGVSRVVLDGATPLARHFYNGVADNAGVTYTGRAIGGRFGIGASQVSSVNADIDISMLLIYTEAHDATQAAAVEAYIAQEYPP